MCLFSFALFSLNPLPTIFLESKTFSMMMMSHKVYVLVIASCVLLSCCCVSTALGTTAGSNTNKKQNVPTFEQGQRINWSTVRTISRTLATCQVVTNPLFNEKTTPVAKTAWQSLKELDLSRVRFAAWYPYPQWGVPEPHPPKWSNDGTRCVSTSWDFTGLMSQLGPFLESVRSVVFEISTLPIWFFSSYGDHAYNASVASNGAYWSYSGIGRWRPNTTQNAADYWGRIASYLLLGSMVDECGKTHHGGPAYLLKANRTGVPVVWEIGNEPRAEWRGASLGDYVATFDAVVTSIRRVIPKSLHHLLQFQGMAINDMTTYSWNWWRGFLDPRNHVPEARDALNWASAHFYSDIKQRFCNDTWQWEFFDPVDEYTTEVAEIVALRDRINPDKKTQTRLSFDEVGSILAGDNDADICVPENRYFVGSGALFAYMFAKLSAVGIDNIGESQLAGVPVIEKWQIYDPQFMSVSMLNWTTGKGNARYYALKLIKEEFSAIAADDEMSNDPPEQIIHPPAALPPRQQLCAAHWAGDPLQLGVSRFVNLTCTTQNSYIDAIQVAHIGYILGHCDNNFALDRANCTDEGGVARRYVEDVCIGRANCSLRLDDFNLLAPSCINITNKEQTTMRLVVKATCSQHGVGYGSPSAYLPDRVFIQARTMQKKKKKKKKKQTSSRRPLVQKSLLTKDGSPFTKQETTVRKLLVINKNMEPAPLQIEEVLNGAEMRMVSENNKPITRSIIETNSTHPYVILPPFATAVITMLN